MSFSSDLRAIANHAGMAIDECIQRTVIELGIKVVEISPSGDALYWRMPAPPGYVGGAFKGNWQHGVGSMPLDTFETKGGEASISRIRASVPEQAGGKVHWLVNNLQYSIALENGHSRQARGPNAIVGRATLQYQEIIRSAARRARRS